MCGEGNGSKDHEDNYSDLTDCSEGSDALIGDRKAAGGDTGHGMVDGLPDVHTTGIKESYQDKRKYTDDSIK